jgi:CheY-like chemotaxis protein
MLGKYLPHALVVDVDLGSQDRDGLHWIESLRGGPFSRLPVIIMTSSHSPLTVARAKSLNVIDYIIKPSNCPTLLRKIHRICQLLDDSEAYSRQIKSNETLSAAISFQNTIAAISETQIYVRGKFRWIRPEDHVSRAICYRTSFFNDRNLAEPALLLNYAEPVFGQDPYCNRFLMSGLKEKDLRNLRQWIWREKLRPLNEKRRFGEEPIFDVSSRRFSISFSESAKILAISETQVELFVPLVPAENARCALMIDQTALPIACGEASQPIQGEVKIKALIEPELSQETLRNLRRLALQ